MIAIFDGHNDVLTKPDHGDFASGRSGGHLDLPRMRAAGMRGGIFAIFSPSPKPPEDSRPRGDNDGPSGSPAELEHDVAAGHATAAAGRLFALERAGALRVARNIADIDAAREDSGPRSRSCTWRGRRRSTLALKRWSSGTRPGCGQSGRCGVARTRLRTGCGSSFPPRPTWAPA